MEDANGEVGKIFASIDQSCIDLATQQLQNDPNGQVVWSGDHAYFIPSNAQEDTDVINLPLSIKLEDQSATEVQLPNRTLSQLSVDLLEGRAMNITKLLNRK
jgi:hypothetical protein